MCEAAPGPRCYSDSQKKVTMISKKIADVSAELDAANKELKRAAGKDFTSYQHAKKRVSVLQTRLTGLSTKQRHAQRDLDSTKTGRAALELQLAGNVSPSEAVELKKRIRAAEALRLCRSTALDIKRTPGYVPSLRFADRAA